MLLTAYNREDYIAESIESVLAQTLTDFELVICDDRSSDGTVAIIEDYARRDRRTIGVACSCCAAGRSCSSIWPPAVR